MFVSRTICILRFLISTPFGTCRLHRQREKSDHTVRSLNCSFLDRATSRLVRATHRNCCYSTLHTFLSLSLTRWLQEWRCASHRLLGWLLFTVLLTGCLIKDKYQMHHWGVKWKRKSGFICQLISVAVLVKTTIFNTPSFRCVACFSLSNRQA